MGFEQNYKIDLFETTVKLKKYDVKHFQSQP